MTASEFRTKRLALELSWQDLSELLEICPSLVSDYEEGNTPIPRMVELALETIENRLKKQFKLAPRSSIAEINQLIGEAKNAELCRDINALRHILSEFWDDFEQTPTFEEYVPAVKAELLRLSGFYLTFYGRSHNKTEYQSRAKDLIFAALEIFDEENLSVGASESRIALAFCYWNSGEIAEAVSCIDSIEAEYENTGHPVYVRAKVNRLLFLVWKSKLDDARKLIEKIIADVKSCRDILTKAMFYSEAGIVYELLKDFKKARLNYKEAIRLAEKSRNERFTALNFNNLAMFHRNLQEYKISHFYAQKALEIYKNLGDDGWIPHVLDTIALIYIDQKNYVESLKIISRAIEIFYKGEDTAGLLDALWTKTKCYLEISERDEALNTFGELQHVAISRIGEIAAKKYSKLLAEEIYVVKKFPLLDEVAEFKKTIVKSAMIEAKGEVVRAAKILGLPNHQTLSQILKVQFPTIREELGMNKRARRTVSKKDVFQESSREMECTTITVEMGKVRQESAIKKIILPDKKYAFEFPFRSPTFETYYFKKSEMENFGKNESAVVAVSPIKQLKPDMTLLVGIGNNFRIGKVEHDDFSNLFFICDEQDFPVLLDDVEIVGEPVGYCLADNTKDEFINFEKL